MTTLLSERPRCFPRLAHRDERPPSRFEKTLGEIDPEDVLLGLSDASAGSLGRLLPAMLCGEESAALVFDNERARVEDGLFRESGSALSRISLEEEHHEELLTLIAARVPPGSDAASLRGAARRFFVRIKSDEIGVHFGRIAALDSAVCILFAELTGGGRPLARAPAIARIFRRILREEASHVAFSRRYSSLLGVDLRDHQESFGLVRSGLVDLLRPCATAFEELGVDPDRLFVRLAGVRMIEA